MSGIKHFKRADLSFEAYGGPPGKATIARLVGPGLSKTMGVGIATFDGCSIEWTVLYDEMIVVLEGLFRLRAGREVFEGRPGGRDLDSRKDPHRLRKRERDCLLRPLPGRLAPAPRPRMMQTTVIAGAHPTPALSPPFAMAIAYRLFSVMAGLVPAMTCKGSAPNPKCNRPAPFGGQGGIDR